MSKPRILTLIPLFAALTAIGAFIRIETPFVPLTMQFAFCAFSGIMLGVLPFVGADLLMGFLVLMAVRKIVPVLQASNLLPSSN